MAQSRVLYPDLGHLVELARPQAVDERRRFAAFLQRGGWKLAISYLHVLETASLGAHDGYSGVKVGAWDAVGHVCALVEEAPTVRIASFWKIVQQEFLKASGQAPVHRSWIPDAPFGNWDYLGKTIYAASFRTEVSRLRQSPSILRGYWESSKGVSEWESTLRGRGGEGGKGLSGLVAAELKNMLFRARPAFRPEDPFAPAEIFAPPPPVGELDFRDCPAAALLIALSSSERLGPARLPGKEAAAPQEAARPQTSADREAAASAAAYADVYLTNAAMARRLRELRRAEPFSGLVHAGAYSNLYEMFQTERRD